MRHVLKNANEVCHIWANQTQNDGRTPTRNCYFEGNTIYSYGSHFPIAKHIENDKGEKAILFSERGYSSETSKHKRMVRHATQHITLIYCYRPDYSHSDNFKWWYDLAKSEASSLPNARKPQLYLSEIARIKERVERYAAFFNLTIDEPLQAIFNIGSKAEYKDFKDAQEVYEKQRNERLQRELKRNHAKQLKEWYAFKINSLTVHNGYDYLRYNLGKGRVETTQHVEIPSVIAEKFYKLVECNCLEVGMKLMDYTVNYVDKNEIRIGCHTFKISYLLEFGKTIFNHLKS